MSAGYAMGHHRTGDLQRLLTSARSLYGDTAPPELDLLEERLAEPLRLAIAGIVKAGKSTLLNAILGDRVAATDAGECTRLITWYRYASSPSVTAYSVDGAARRLPLKTSEGELTFDLDVPTESVERIEIGWPAPALTSLVVIDTPGIASLTPASAARTTGFLVPDETPPAADAMIYLLRRAHPSDLRFLEAFRDTAAGRSGTVNAVAVLSRADEIGSGRIDSLLSARRVAKRYEQEDSLDALALGVFPVAGLLAEGARTMTEPEFRALHELAGLERTEREGLLVSADRFVRLARLGALDEAGRKRLISRFGIFGIRLASSLIRTGLADVSDLTTEMTRQSGLSELLEFIERQFIGRTATLKTHGVLDGLEVVLRTHPVDDASQLEEEIERIRLMACELDELTLLAQARKRRLASVEDASTALRILGAEGLSVNERLGLPTEVDPHTLDQRLAEEIRNWRVRSHDRAHDRTASEATQVVLRSLERMRVRLQAGDPDPADSELGALDLDDRATPDVVLPRRPGDRAGEGAREQGEEGESDLSDQHLS